MAGWNTWSPQTRRRADREHARKQRAKQQRRHLLRIKTPAQLRQMVLASRVRQR